MNLDLIKTRKGLYFHASPDGGTGGGGGTGDAGTGGEGDKAAGGSGAGDPAGGAGDPGASGGDGGVGDGAGARPAHIPVKFWDAEKREPRYKELAESYTNLEKKLGQTREEVTAEVRAELKKEGLQGVPESPEGYKLPAIDFSEYQEAYGQGFKYEIPEDSELMTFMKGMAHKHSLSETEFGDLINEYVKFQIGQIPPPGAAAKGLGEDGQDRVQRLDLFLQHQLPDDEYMAIASAKGMTTDYLKGLERLMSMARQGAPGRFENLPGSSGTPAGNVTMADVEAAMNDPRYRKDAEYTKMVQEMHAKAFAANKKRASG